MTLMPVVEMWKRIQIARDDSDTSLFFDLVRFGEMLTKITAAALVAAVMEDRERHRYRQLYSLVRANGLGPWSKAIDEVLTGPTTQFLMPEAEKERRELNEKCGPGTWQYDSLKLLNQSLNAVGIEVQPLHEEESARKWFSTFKLLRDKSTGHGAIPSNLYSKACADLEESIRLIADNFSLFARPWAYLHRNLSSKYRVTKLTTEDISPFDYLRTTRTANLPNGVYIHLGDHVRVELLDSDADATDFLLPNGNFKSKQFEMLSYITGRTRNRDAKPYMVSPNHLPASETEGIGVLDVQGHSFTNLPPLGDGYIHRDKLEAELYRELMNDYQRIVTLVGRGGIGKTSLALSVAYKVADEKRFEAIVWFSARDVDLLAEGPVAVRKKIFSKRDIAKEFTRLVAPTEANNRKFNSLTYFEQALTKSPTGDPFLFIFDNFETVENPVELANWINTYIRTPNKALLTSRFHQFKAEYAVTVAGMEYPEAEELIDRTADDRQIGHLITEQYKRDLFEESEGHPYAIKVLLGDVAKVGKLVPVKRIWRSKEQILEVLFEKTFSDLSFIAQRVFLTLCDWRSIIPQVAVEAVLIGDPEERMDVEEAIEELVQSSLVEREASERDGQYFISVPLAALEYGKRQLRLHPLKIKVQADTELLYRFGATQSSGIRHGIAPHIQRFFGSVASNPDELNERLPMLEYIASKYPPAWRLLVSLYEESGERGSLEEAKKAVQRYLQRASEETDIRWAWDKLASLCQKTNDYSGEIHALVEMCQLHNTSLDTLNYSAGRLLSVLHDEPEVWSKEEKQIILRQLVEVMEEYTAQARANDLGRLAWLCLNLVPKDVERAKRYTKLGLDREPNNRHLKNLAKRLSLPNSSTTMYR